MDKINILTWNTSLYLEKTNEPISEKYSSFANIVKKHLEKDNSIAFLQEIPYVSNETWQKHSLFNKLNSDFSNDKYDIEYNITSKNQIMMTVAITRKGEMKRNNAMINDNRTISIEFNGLHFTGIHAKNGADNKKYLNAIDNNDADIILGDFNSGNYLESENRDTFNQILKEYICICNMPTKITKTGRRTCIDHVFVREEMVTNCSNLIIHEEIKLSDHFPVTFEINK
ncbi:MAG: hypothetical protein CVU98_11345 [Firmicutes bacterium HGW-Firmicutes-3]|jgi:exonuclease III|nr:MAG: hypothetical protein CVU98_11345 [Firmicutes bacterium HGW-Firmicutes-3]